jgi:hypothetical protein
MQRVNAELKRRRDLNDVRSKYLLKNCVDDTPINYINDDPEQLISDLSSNGKGTIFVSFHTLSYFYLFVLMDKWKFKVNCIVVDSILRRFSEWDYKPPPGVTLDMHLDKQAIKELISNKRSLFIMADVLFPHAINHAIWIMEKVTRYTITWAELAMRYDLNVVALFIKDKGESFDLFAKQIDSHDGTPYDLACNMFSAFENFLGTDTDLWENFPNVDILGFPIKYPQGAEGEDLTPLIDFLGATGLGTARSLRALPYRN